MKKNLFLYLFIFSLLINVFTYMFFTGKQKYEQERVTAMETKVKADKDSLKAEKVKMANENYFTLENDVNAKEYFAGQDVTAIAIKVRDEIYKQNITPGGNPLIGYPAMDGKPFSIAKIRVLNHRWVIADFSNGLRWGEVILKYFIEEDGSVSFERADTVLYEFKPY
ncbi:hypothetical protein R1T16_09060 [Flavobacterium sp. DG1-102-2]|uniref:hypothetical protein n=1 Tax=Flavobacterium sp. DG1-102-2 TaxID=3081663 RepID=UPI002949F519|nr:hypothetical protein [Flavobacterium sp. DG1-102-2]MDV6168571.1 hypothetical protein [Flavobacterium sp. DG1-102-2]